MALPFVIRQMYGADPQVFVTRFVTDNHTAIKKLLSRVVDRTGIEKWSAPKPGNPNRRLTVRLKPLASDPVSATALQLVCWAIVVPEFLKDEANRLIFGMPVGVDADDRAPEWRESYDVNKLASVDPIVTPALAAVLITAIIAVVVVAVIVLPAMMEWGSYAVMQDDYIPAVEAGAQTGGGDPKDAAFMTAAFGPFNGTVPKSMVGAGVNAVGAVLGGTTPEDGGTRADSGKVDLRPQNGPSVALLAGAALVLFLVLR